MTQPRDLERTEFQTQPEPSQNIRSLDIAAPSLLLKSYEATLDGGLRISLPAPYRRILGRRVLVASIPIGTLPPPDLSKPMSLQDRCVVIGRPDSSEAIANILDASFPAGSYNERERRRLIFSNMNVIELDRQNRFRLLKEDLEVVGIGKGEKGKFIGQGEYCELWNPEYWYSYYNWLTNRGSE